MREQVVKGKKQQHVAAEPAGRRGLGGDALVLVGARVPGPRDTKPEDGPQRVSLA